MNKVYMISGHAGSGKGEVASALEKELMKDGYTVLNIAFGDAVKFIAEKFYDWNGEKDEAGRALLQSIGTEKMRSVYKDFWAEFVAKLIVATQKDFMYVIINDWRFVNEFEVINDYIPNNVTIRVKRYNADGSEYINPSMTEEQRQHISETELDKFPFDYIIENRGDLEELNDNVLAILEDTNDNN